MGGADTGTHGSTRRAFRQYPLGGSGCVPIPGLTALRALRRGGFLLHKRVMITGATGIVGSIAIELAAASGAQVTAVARRDAHSRLRALGAS